MKFIDMLPGQMKDKTNIANLQREIDERKKAEEDLRKTNRLFALFMQHSPIYTFIKEVTPTESRVLQASENFSQMIGIPGSEMAGKTMTELFPPEFAAKITADDWAVVSMGIVLKLEEEFNGRTYDTIKFPIIQGDKSLLACYTIDVTERKQKEEEARKLLLMLESVPNSIIVHGANGNCLYANQRAFDMHGYSRDEFMALDLTRITVPGSEKLIDARIPEIFDRGETSFEIEHVKKNGTILPLWINIKKVIWNGKNAFLSVGTDITERKRAEEELQHTLERLREAFGANIQILASAVEARDPYTAGHQIRSANLARAIAMELELPPQKIEGIRMAGSIHDIGKLSIPAEILTKPTKLSYLEFSLIKEHAQRGYEMLKNVESPWPLAEIVYQHHERMDGSGYPRNLQGDEICLEARILTVADVVEAMASHRPYRAGLGIDIALDEIEKNRGIFYDSTVVDACLRLFREKGFKLQGI